MGRQCQWGGGGDYGSGGGGGCGGGGGGDCGGGGGGGEMGMLEMKSLEH